MQKVNSSFELLTLAEQERLYLKLIEQLNKDLKFANIDLEFASDLHPTALKEQLQETVYRLIHGNFADYLNLLYIIDVSENMVKALDGSDILKLSDEVCFLILKREWQKVWYKNRY